MKSLLGHDHHDRNSARETLIRYTIPFNLMDFESKFEMAGNLMRNVSENNVSTKRTRRLPQLIVHDGTLMNIYQPAPAISNRRKRFNAVSC